MITKQLQKQKLVDHLTKQAYQCPRRKLMSHMSNLVHQGLLPDLIIFVSNSIIYKSVRGHAHAVSISLMLIHVFLFVFLPFLFIVREAPEHNEDAESEKQRNRAKKIKLCHVILTILVIFLSLIIISTVAMGLVSDIVTIPPSNRTSNLTVYFAQSNPVPVMLNVFSSVDYKSCTVTSNIKSFSNKDTPISGTLWVVPTLPQPNKNLYTDSFKLGPYNHSNEYYIGPSSNLTVIFSSLSGTGIVTVQFINYSSGSLLTSKQVKESTKNQTVNYIYNGSEVEYMYIEVKILTTGQLTGSYMYNFTIYELDNSTLEQSQYSCTVNYTNDICQVPSVYNNNYLIGLITLDGHDSQNHPTVNMTLVGQEKKNPQFLSIFMWMIIIGIIIGIIFVIIVLPLMIVFRYFYI